MHEILWLSEFDKVGCMDKRQWKYYWLPNWLSNLAIKGKEIKIKIHFQFFHTTPKKTQFTPKKLKPYKILITSNFFTNSTQFISKISTFKSYEIHGILITSNFFTNSIQFISKTSTFKPYEIHGILITFNFFTQHSIQNIMKYHRILITSNFFTLNSQQLNYINTQFTPKKLLTNSQTI